jgi:hypothetical protein
VASFLLAQLTSKIYSECFPESTVIFSLTSNLWYAEHVQYLPENKDPGPEGAALVHPELELVLFRATLHFAGKGGILWINGSGKVK